MEKTTVDNLFKAWFKQFDEPEKDEHFIKSLNDMVKTIKDYCPCPDNIRAAVKANASIKNYKLVETDITSYETSNEITIKFYFKTEIAVRKLLISYQSFEGMFSTTAYFFIEWDRKR